MLEFLAAIKETVVNFGLLMHVGATENNGKLTQSKTKAMCFPEQPSTLTKEQLVPQTMCFSVMTTASTSIAPISSNALVADLFPLCLMKEMLRFEHNKLLCKPDNS